MKILKYKLWILLVCLGQFGIHSCQKGDLDEAFVDFARISIESINQLYVDSLDVDGKGAKNLQGYYIFPYNKNKDSIDLTLFYDYRTKSIKSRVPNSKMNTFYVYYNNPLENKIVISKDHPLPKEEVDKDSYKTKIVNLNKRISPNNEPIHLALYAFKEPYQVGVDLYEPPYLKPAVDTIFNINNQIPEEYKQLKYVPQGYMYRIGKILKANKEELKIDGKNVYVYLSNTSSLSVLCIEDSDFTDLDFNDPNFSLFTDGGIAITAEIFWNR